MPLRTLFPDLLEVHRKIVGLIISLEVESDPEESADLAEELIILLAGHMATEDQIIIPTLRRFVDEHDARVMLHESAIDHEEMWDLAGLIGLARAGRSGGDAVAVEDLYPDLKAR